jgi:hypothetical protein
MQVPAPDNVVRLEPALRALRDQFIGWQCRVRQHAARRDGARPSPGMRPRVHDGDGKTLATAVTTLLAEVDPTASTALFRHAFQRTHDPRERYQKALEILAESYFQRPADFTDRLTAVFAPHSALAARLAALGTGVLVFEQFSQQPRIACRIEELADDDPWYQAAFWHNRLFNPELPPGPHIIAFVPVWGAPSW